MKANVEPTNSMVLIIIQKTLRIQLAYVFCARICIAMLPILNQSFWRDEAFSILLSERSPWQIIQLTIRDQSPPLYSLILHYWMIFYGQSEAAVRGLSLLFHFGLVITVYLISRKLIQSSKVQILIAIVTLLNPFLLQYAFEARMYTLLALLIALAVYCITLRKYWLAGIVLSLGILTHNFAIFSCVAIGIWWIVKNRIYIKSHFYEGLSLFLFPLLTLVGWGVVIWNQWVRVGKGFWIPPVTSQIFLDTFQKYAQGDIYYPSEHMLLLLSVILGIFAFSYWVWKKDNKNIEVPSLLFSASVIPIVITYIISVLFAPIYHERYLIATAPLLIILIGYSVYKVYEENMHKQMILIIFLSGYMTILILSGEQILNSSSKPSINWGVKQILAQAKPTDVIIPKDVLNYLETKLYVEESGSNIPVYAYSPNGTIPFYIGSVLFDKQHIITRLPRNQRIWQVEPDGGYKLIFRK